MGDTMAESATTETSIAGRAIERLARETYGRLLAIVAARTRDIAAAEDALGDAFAEAIEQWPRTGAPQNPAGWLITVARRRAIDRQRSIPEGMLSLDDRMVEVGSLTAPRHAADGTTETNGMDERLSMLFLCAHPSVDAAVRMPLMLQTVLGIEVRRIASALVTSPSALAQRLVRVKTKIHDSDLSFAMPEGSELERRRGDVMACIYAAASVGLESFMDEALWLADSLADPHTGAASSDPEALGLQALLGFLVARRGARRDAEGRFVPLIAQDPSRWSRPLIDRSEAILARAAQSGRFGRFQLEAAIQSAHCARLRTGQIDWPAIEKLYQALLSIAPSIGARCSAAAAAAESRGAAAGLSILAEFTTDESRVSDYQPYWATKAPLLAAIGDREGALAAYERAIGLCDDGAVRVWLTERAADVRGGVIGRWS